MTKPEVALCNQTKNINRFIQVIQELNTPVILGGVQFFLKDLKQMSADMQMIAKYVALDVESLRRENKYLRELMDNE